MPTSPKLDAKSLPHVPGYTVWENANGFGRPGYRPGSGNQYADGVNALGSIDKRGARLIAYTVLCPMGAVFGYVYGSSWMGGKGAMIGICAGVLAGLVVGRWLGLFLVRLAALLMVLVPVGIGVWIAASLLIDLWNR